MPFSKKGKKKTEYPRLKQTIDDGFNEAYRT